MGRLNELGIVLLVACSLEAQHEEKIETWDGGKVKARFLVDAQGRKHGAYTAFHEDGSLALKAVYRDDVLDGAYQTFHPNGARHITGGYARGKLYGTYEEVSDDGSRVWTATWGDGKLQGDSKLAVHKKVAMTQKWRDGVISLVNGFAPHPVAAAEIRTQVEKILSMPAPSKPATDDPKASQRYAALRRLQAYRYLCGVPWDSMELDPAYNDLCDAAAEVCEKLGRLSHTPPDPGGLPPGRYEKGRQGAGSSNLAVGTDLPGSVDMYMDDSDESNITALGHRRWCILPELRRTGFGLAKPYSAMWSMDRSARAPKGLKTVKYPPAGFVPADFFGNRHAWSVSFVTGPWSARINPKATLEKLDEHYLPAAKPLEVRTWIATGGYGTTNCVAFLPTGLEALPGRSYLATLSLDGGATKTVQYVVEFIEPMAKTVPAPR